MKFVMEFQDVAYRYPGGVTALKGATFSIGEGERVSIVGPNGGGKTTLLKLALGVLTPDSGTVRLFGESPQKTCALVGYVPQQDRLDPKYPITCREVVEMGVTGKRRKTQALEAMEWTGVEDLARRPFAALSGGQRQRVLLARALAGEPQLLLLDEPLASVDPGAGEALTELLRALAGRMTVATVTHDLNFVAEEVEKVVCVSRTVHVHPTEALTGELRAHLYGAHLAVVKHDECITHGTHCEEAAHTHADNPPQ